MMTIKVDEFYSLLSAIFLEVSVIIISDTLPMLSSAAIGM